MDAVRSSHDDFVEVVGTLNEDKLSEIIQGGFPSQVLEGLNGNMQSKQAVFETLYRWAKSDLSGALSTAAQTAVAEQQAQARAAKIGAAVATATTGTEAAPPAPVEGQVATLLGEEWDDMKSSRSVEKAWTGRPERTPR